MAGLSFEGGKKRIENRYKQPEVPALIPMNPFRGELSFVVRRLADRAELSDCPNEERDRSAN